MTSDCAHQVVVPLQRVSSGSASTGSRASVGCSAGMQDVLSIEMGVATRKPSSATPITRLIPKAVRPAAVQAVRSRFESVRLPQAVDWWEVAQTSLSRWCPGISPPTANTYRHTCTFLSKWFYSEQLTQASSRTLLRQRLTVTTRSRHRHGDLAGRRVGADFVGAGTS